MPPKALLPVQTPAETRVKLKALRKMSTHIKEEIHENDRLEGKILVMVVRTQRLAYEAEERKRQLDKAKDAQHSRLASREHDVLVRREAEAALLVKQTFVHMAKKNARARLLKPPPQPPNAALSRFRRAGALVAAAQSKNFFGTLAVLESGKLGESIIKDMKLHKLMCVEQRLRLEADKSTAVAYTLTRMQLDPETKRRKEIEKKLRSAERHLTSTATRWEALEPPHSPLLLRRPVTPGTPLGVASLTTRSPFPTSPTRAPT
jgi:hypothetical protein